MPVYKYRPYYSYRPSVIDPLVEELSEEEVERNIRLLDDDLINSFEESEEAVISSENGVVAITSDLTEARCDEIMAKCLSGLHLFAEKLSG